MSCMGDGRERKEPDGKLKKIEKPNLMERIQFERNENVDTMPQC